MEIFTNSVSLPLSKCENSTLFSGGLLVLFKFSDLLYLSSLGLYYYLQNGIRKTSGLIAYKSTNSTNKTNHLLNYMIEKEACFFCYRLLLKHNYLQITVP